MPALLIKISIVPKACITAVVAASTSALWTVLTLKNCAFAPICCNMAAVSKPLASLTSQIARAAPSSANRIAVAFPMPFAPPVMMATLFFNLIIFLAIK